MKFNVFLIYIILFESFVNAQLLPYSYSGIEEKALERMIYTDSNSHASVKPWLISFSQWQQIDSTRLIVQHNNFTTFVKPILNVETNQNFTQFHQIGAESYSTLSKKISVHLSLSQCFIKPD